MFEWIFGYLEATINFWINVFITVLYLLAVAAIVLITVFTIWLVAMIVIQVIKFYILKWKGRL